MAPAYARAPVPSYPTAPLATHPATAAPTAAPTAFPEPKGHFQLGATHSTTEQPTVIIDQDGIEEGCQDTPPDTPPEEQNEEYRRGRAATILVKPGRPNRSGTVAFRKD